MSEVYSHLKALRHLDVIADVRDHKPARPVHVQLILSDLCNQSCDFCAYRDPTYSSSQMFYEIKAGPGGLRRDAEHQERNYNPNRMITRDKALEIIADCARMGVQGIQFTGGGEPTVHPDWALLMLATQSRGLKTSMVTNGVNLGKSQADSAEVTAASRCEWVRVSIDAGLAATYQTIRHVPASHFDAAWRAVELLRDRGPIVGVGFVVTPGNWQEIYTAAELAKRHGASNIRIGAQFSQAEEKLFSGFAKEAAELARHAESLTGDGFTVVNRFSEKLDDLKQRAPDYERCGYQYFTTYIGADLNVYRCCVTAYNEQGLIGSLKDQSFSHLWEAQSRVDEMDRFKAKSCDRCQFNGINRVLDYVIRSDDPMHSEFV